MDYQEAIKHCKEVARKNRENNVRNTIVIPNHWISSAHCAEEYEQLAKWLEELQEYKQLGTLEEIENALNKQIPKSPTYDGDGYAPDGTFVWDEWICPRCGTRYEVEYEEHDYCPNCGQHIDWSE